jgi:hypothetical protein
MLIETVGDGTVRVRPGTAEEPDAVVSGPPEVVVWLLVGRLTLAQARARGAHVRGRVGILERLRRAGSA